MSISIGLSLGSHQRAVDDRLTAWTSEDFGARLWRKDPTLWSAELLPEIVDRLGWLQLPDLMRGQIAELEQFGREIVSAGITHAVVLGMGGSSLAPEVFSATYRSAPGYPQLLVLDSTHPAAVDAVEAATPPEHTLYIVSSKSGGTLETMSFMRFFWDRTLRVLDDPGSRFVAVTDHDSGLEKLATERRFRRTFLAEPDVGGRYSALTPFGLVPAAVLGADLGAFQAVSSEMAARCGETGSADDNPGLVVGAVLGELALAGVDKVTFATGPDLAAFPAWIEQLIAESTGKDDRGIIPIGGEPLASPSVYGSDRLFVHLAIAGETHNDREIAALSDAGHPVLRIQLDSPADLAGAMYLLEVAVAAAGAVLGIHPFNQPDVQLAKDLAKKAMAGELDATSIEAAHALDNDLGHRLEGLLASLSDSDYFSIQAYLPPTEEYRLLLQDGRLAVRDHRAVATTLDFGPRFLHSTGQLHKGGPNSGVFLQIIDDPSPHVEVPETDFDFGKLITGQADGDFQALESRHRRVLRVSLGASGRDGIGALVEALQSSADA